jgi:hypothetical protein
MGSEVHPAAERRGRPILVAVVLALAGALFVGVIPLSVGPAAGVPITDVGPLVAGDPVIAAAGDIACPRGTAVGATNCHHGHTSDLLAGVTAVLTLGDNQYENGALADFQASFDPTWGRFKAIMYPSAGNHEYNTAGATGYYDYFGPAAGARDKGYYSFDVGSWHLIALNSNCSPVGGCEAGSPQERWLRADLAAHPSSCTLAYWHHPLFSSGPHGSISRMAAIWQALYDHKADVVLTGHDHNYQRFAPQTTTGVASARGIREFVVGTGGRGHYANGTPIANQEVQNSGTFGVLKLTLHSTSYDWKFVPEPGGTFTDSGSGPCVTDAVPNRPPAITSNGGGATAAISKPENQTAATDVNATDPDGDTLAYSIGGGVDAGSFAINGSSGVLTFATAPDFEQPADSNRDNVYQVTVRVSDGTLTDTQAVAVTVTDVVETAPDPALSFSLRAAATVGGVNAENEDIVSRTGAVFSLAFDGSDVGVASRRVDAFSWLGAGTLLLSFDTAGSVPGISGTVDDSDVVRFDSTSLGTTTRGTFSLYFDGSDVGLTADAHDVDAFELLPDGRILISTTGSVTVAGVTAPDEDLLAFAPTSLGANTAGKLALFFDGSDVGLGGSGEDVDAVAVDASGRIYLSTFEAFSVPGIAGQDEDVFVFTPSALGSTTAGSFSSTLRFDGSTFGLGSNNLLAIDLS